MVAAVGKKANVNSSTTLYGVGEGPGYLGKRAFLRIWPRSWMWASSEMRIALNSLVLCCPGGLNSIGVAIQIVNEADAIGRSSQDNILHSVPCVFLQ